MKRVFFALGPIASTFAVAVILLASPAGPITEFQAETDRQQVDLLGHSLGTFVSQSYPASPPRAAEAAHGASVDGRGADALPSGVPTLALRAGPTREAQGETVGAIDTTIREQERVVVPTSPRSFVEIHRVFTGREPAASEIAPSFSPWIPVSARTSNVRKALSSEGWVSIQLNDYG